MSPFPLLKTLYEHDCVTQVWTATVCFSKHTRIILAFYTADKDFQCSVLTAVFSFLGPQPQINSL